MTTNPLQARLAAIWDTAMGDGNGMAAAAALSQAVTAARAAVPESRRPGWAPRVSSRSRARSCTHPGRRDSGELSLAAVLAWDRAAAAAIPFESPIAVSQIAASLAWSGLVVVGRSAGVIGQPPLVLP